MIAERQHSIDMMPESVRARAQAGVRLGQFIAVAVVSMTMSIALATHSHLLLSSAQERLFALASEAEQVFATEARSAQLKHELAALQAYSEKYQKLAFPISVGNVIATVVNALPESITLDNLDLDAGSRVVALGPRSRGVAAGDPESAPPRVLTAELSGFAASDQDIAELVSTLEATVPFEDVSLDFSRSRRVNDKDAREFRVSFRIDLDRHYQVAHTDADTKRAAPRRVADAND
jgi:hypothetical protein